MDRVIRDHQGFFLIILWDNTFQGDSEIMNQTPEPLARDPIDKRLAACGWIVQDKKQLALGAGPGVAVREYQTDVGPSGYVLFVDRKPVGIIEAKKEKEGVHLGARGAVRRIRQKLAQASEQRVDCSEP